MAPGAASDHKSLISTTFLPRPTSQIPILELCLLVDLQVGPSQNITLRKLITVLTVALSPIEASKRLAAYTAVDYHVKPEHTASGSF